MNAQAAAVAHPEAAVGPRRGPRVLLALTDVMNHGGIQRFNRTLLAALSRLGVEADVLSLNDSVGEGLQLAEAPTASIRGFGRNKLHFSVALAGRLAEAGYDLLIVGHLHFARLVTAASKVPNRRLPPRVLLVAHGVEVWHSLTGRTRRAMATMTDIVSVSSYTEQMILEQAPELARKRLHVFPNALAATWIQWASHLASVPLDPAIRQPFVLSVTRLGSNERTKGVVSAIEAFSMLARRDVHYVIAGGGDDLPFLRHCAARRGVADRVHFVGSTSDEQLMALYRGCAAFVLPSGQEGFGIVFLEAMYFNAPVVAAREKGAVDVVADGESGLLVDFGDVVALHGAMERVLGDQALRKHLQAGGRRLVEDGGPFTFDAFVRRTDALVGSPADSVLLGSR